VLWEEQSLLVLQEAHSTAARALASLLRQEEALPEADRPAAFAEGFARAMAPVLVKLQAHLTLAEECPSHTPHEARALQALLPRLRALHAHLGRLGSQDAAGAQACVKMIKQAASATAQMLKNERLQLSELAPGLAGLRGTAIPVAPGSASGGPTIEHSLPDVQLLHTKTRPKRLTFVASDGSQCVFLLKARAGVGGWGVECHSRLSPRTGASASSSSRREPGLGGGVPAGAGAERVLLAAPSAQQGRVIACAKPTLHKPYALALVRINPDPGSQGHEDLRIDERLSQVLRASTSALRADGAADLRAQSLLVLPLSRRVGMIKVRAGVPCQHAGRAALLLRQSILCGTLLGALPPPARSAREIQGQPSPCMFMTLT
jgi:hypothetical protein